MRPVLVWPRAISEHLDERQIATILAHEIAHVQRRDNLIAAIHMAVEAIFWFHPLVWWLGARLMVERERACDEAVVSLGNDPRVYAETILKACRTYLESPLTCVAGITGSDLRARIARIVLGAPTEALTFSRKLLVAALPTAAVIAPIAIGFLDAPHLRAAGQIGLTANQALPRFEVAAVKPNRSGAAKVMIQTPPGGRFAAENVTLRALILFAYRLQPPQLAGGPGWLDSDRFDVQATGDGDGGDQFDADKRGEVTRTQLMLRALLAERFKLAVHTESHDMPIYALVLARRDGTLGPALHQSTADCSPAAERSKSPSGPPSAGGVPCGIRIAGAPGTMVAGGASMRQLAGTLINWVGRIVFDRTGLSGSYDFTLSWTPDQMPQGFNQKVAAGGLAPADPNGPSIFTAVQEQLGLKLDAERGAVDVLVIDRVEKPVGN